VTRIVYNETETETERQRGMKKQHLWVAFSFVFGVLYLSKLRRIIKRLPT